MRWWFKIKLWQRVLAALVLGVATGLVMSGTMGQEAATAWIETWLRPVGDLFINLIRMLIVPLIFTTLVAGVIAIAMKIVGVLLITAMLIIPAATARRLSGGPEHMAVIAAVVGAIAVVGGLFASLEWDTPSGPSIVVAALVLFLASLSPVAASKAGGPA